MAGRPAIAAARTRGAESTLARSSVGTNLSPARRNTPAQAAGAGSSARNVEPTDATPSTDTKLNSESGAAPPPATTSSTPACSTMWRGGSSISTSTTTPHTGTIGRQLRVGSITSGAHGPAATSTDPAAQCSPPRAPRAHPRR